MMALPPRSPDDAVIVAAKRTPIGRAHKGSLVGVRPDDLAASLVRTILEPLPAPVVDEIEDVLTGCAQPAGPAGYNLARIIAILAGLPQAGGATVNRYCASSLETVATAARAIRAHQGRAFVAAGVEVLSGAGAGADSGPPNPVFEPGRARTERALAQGLAWSPSNDVFPDVYISMGLTAEFVRTREGVTRTEMDEFAVRSHQRAVAAQESGFFAREIVPARAADGRTVTVDDGPRPATSLEQLGSLKPVFHPEGEVTAGNSCPLNDGAAAMVVVQRSLADEHGLTPLARVVAAATAGLEPELMGLGPVPATQKVLARCGLSIADVDRVEINEAFAAQAIPSARRLGVPDDRLNLRGGAIALGHPYGMSGVRLVLTLVNALQTDDLTLGLATMCIGGGQGMALVVEREL